MTQEHHVLQFPFAGWRRLPESFDANGFPDECFAPGEPNLTGTFVGMADEDLSGTCRPVDVDRVE